MGVAQEAGRSCQSSGPSHSRDYVITMLGIKSAGFFVRQIKVQTPRYGIAICSRAFGTPPMPRSSSISCSHEENVYYTLTFMNGSAILGVQFYTVRFLDNVTPAERDGNWRKRCHREGSRSLDLWITYTP